MEHSKIQSLIQEINTCLQDQGYTLSDGVFALKQTGKDALRQTQAKATSERMTKRIPFIFDHRLLVHARMIDGRDVQTARITPQLIPVTRKTSWDIIFRWWNYTWWSVPYERPYGRQMRYIVWDAYHQAVIGLIGLQSPILAWAPRDQYLGITSKNRVYWVNQSLSAQRIGAVPPYHLILGGKLVAMLMTSDAVCQDFQKKYEQASTILQGQTLPASLLFITTTGAFGKSSLYTRLKFHQDWLAIFLGYTQGSGTFHIPDTVYYQLIELLRNRGVDVSRGFGSGPSKKLRLIRQGMRLLGFPDGGHHGVQRALYLFPMIRNLQAWIAGTDSSPIWCARKEDELTDYWKARWIEPRIAAKLPQLHACTRQDFLFMSR